MKSSSTPHQIANRKALEWQAGYGAVSFGTKDLPRVTNYIKRQKESITPKYKPTSVWRGSKAR